MKGIADELFAKETLTGDEFMELFEKDYSQPASPFGSTESPFGSGSSEPGSIGDNWP